MRVAHGVFDGKWTWPDGGPEGSQLVLAFGSPEGIRTPRVWEALSEQAGPRSVVVGCTTAGHIAGSRLVDAPIAATAIRFAHTRVTVVSAPVTAATSFDAGKHLAAQLQDDDLCHVLLLSEGVDVSGSALADGLSLGLPRGVRVTGGLAGDDGHFASTLTVLGTGLAASRALAIGLHSRRLRVGFASVGGWDPFGPERLVTHAEGCTVFRLDGKPALPLYRRYLGPMADDLPRAGLFFPLAVRQGDRPAVVRTLLGVDEVAEALRFAGSVPTGSVARLMKANVHRLTEGAGAAGARAREALGCEPEFGLLVSCVGRKLVLRQRVEEELECVANSVGAHVPLCGFYSNGELCPSPEQAVCDLHNQTMTVTVMSEADHE